MAPSGENVRPWFPVGRSVPFPGGGCRLAARCIPLGDTCVGFTTFLGLPHFQPAVELWPHHGEVLVSAPSRPLGVV